MKDTATSDELSVLFGVSVQTVRELARRGVIGRKGKTFPVAESFRRYAASLRSTASAAGRPMALAVSEQRARKLRLECDAMEREELMARGKLILAANLERDLSSKFRAFRDGMMQFPSSLSWLDREAHNRLVERIRELLTDFAEGRPYLKVDDAKGEEDGRPA